MKVLHYYDTGFDCAAVVRETSEEAARHAQDMMVLLLVKKTQE